MAWKTPGGHMLSDGDRVVWSRGGVPDWKVTGTVVETTLVNDETDGEARIMWDAGVIDPCSSSPPPHYYYPWDVEIIDKVNIVDRLFREL